MIASARRVSVALSNLKPGPIKVAGRRYRVLTRRQDGDWTSQSEIDDIRSITVPKAHPERALPAAVYRAICECNIPGAGLFLAPAIAGGREARGQGFLVDLLIWSVLVFRALCPTAAML